MNDYFYFIKDQISEDLYYPTSTADVVYEKRNMRCKHGSYSFNVVKMWGQGLVKIDKSKIPNEYLKRCIPLKLAFLKYPEIYNKKAIDEAGLL